MIKEEIYFYSKNNVTFGPFTLEKITKLIQEHVIQPNSWMYTVSTNWVAASSFKQFSADFNKTNKKHLESNTENSKDNCLKISSEATYSKDSILKLPWINENPFRMLDVPVTATKREIEKSLSKPKTFAKNGKTLNPNSDYGLPSAPQDSIKFLEYGASVIDQAEKRLRYSIFWFWGVSAIVAGSETNQKFCREVAY